MKTFQTEYEIYFEDISPSGMVHLEKIAEWMSMGRERFFKATCDDHMWLSEGDTAIFTVSMQIYILEKAKWADKIKLKITIFDIKRISYGIHYEFLNERTQEIIARGVQKVAFMNRYTGKFTGISEDIKKIIVDYVNPK